MNTPKEIGETLRVRTLRATADSAIMCNPQVNIHRRETEMTTDSFGHILYLGRNGGIATELHTLLQRDHASHAVRAEESTHDLRWQAVVSQKDALRSIQDGLPAVVLIETTGRPESRLHFCEMLRSRMPVTPIVAVGHGGGRYLFPFNAVIRTPLDPAQALNALRSLRTNSPPQTVESGLIHLNINSRTVTTPQGQHVMTPKQCALLTLLMQNPNNVVKRADIMRSIWETSYLGDMRTLDVHIRWLREIIEPDPSSPIYVLTVRGVGYKFQPATDPSQAAQS